MSKITKEKRDRLLLVGTVTAIALACLWFLVIDQQRQTLANNDRKSKELAANIAKADLIAKTEPIVKKMLEDRLETLQAREEEMAPENDPYAWMLDILSKFSQDRLKETHLDKPDIRSSELIPGCPYRFAVFHFKGVGFYTAIGRFIADFENTYRLFQIRNVTLVPGGGPSGPRPGTLIPGEDETLTVEFQIVTPVRLPESQAITE